MKINTTKFKQTIKKNLQKIRLIYLASIDIKRFSRNAAFSLYDNNFDQISSRIIYNVHAIEKGLSRDEDMRLGFGKKALSELNDSLVMFEKKRYNKESFAYVEGRSIIQKYKKFHQEKLFDCSFMKEIVNDNFFDDREIYQEAGVKLIRSEDKINNSNKNFYELAQGRSSIREFSGKKIEKIKVVNALRNAEKTPSVCNRQGWKVFMIEDKEIIEQALILQKGFKGYKNLPEVLLAITVTNNAFLSPVERNEVFIDGGLFAMSVIYGLEYEGLAAVSLNAMMNSNDEKAVRKLLKINDSDQLILFVAIGSFNEETIVPISDRKKVESFLKVV